MDFRRGRRRDEPEINFIPLIDLLLVILIFLMVTTTYSRFADLKLNLPSAALPRQAEPQTRIINIAVTAQGRYQLDAEALPEHAGVAQLGERLRAAAGGKDDATVVISADAQATHQSVVNVMEAARTAGITHLTFATQAPAQ